MIILSIGCGIEIHPAVLILETLQEAVQSWKQYTGMARMLGEDHGKPHGLRNAHLGRMFPEQHTASTA
jgi:hypothetical protein